jgi:hypothetical protein
MDDAAELMQNMYTFRGRWRKRFGSLLMGASQLNSRLAVNIGMIGSSIVIPNNPANGSTQLQIGQMFSVGADIFTIYQLGPGVLTYSTNTLATATINSTTNPNTVVFTGEINGTIVYWYPSNPVMGLTQYENGAINNHPSYAFDTQFAYLFAGGVWTRSGTAVWNGTNLNYFWIENWQGSQTTAATPPVMFVTNFNFTLGSGTPLTTDDPIWSTNDGNTWIPDFGVNGFYFMPGGGAVQTGPFVQTALMIIAFKNRLLLLNTVENDNSAYSAGPPIVPKGVASQYKNRCRFSFNGSPFARNAWYEPNQSDSSGGVVNNNNLAAGASYIDASTEEAIVSAQFIKDRLIVYFERSAWEIAYTGNQADPFVWQKINTELGSQATFSTVPFDRDILTIGNTGIHACNGSNVKRIDTKIPQEVFDNFAIKNSAPKRIAGIRDYFTELVYWAFVDTAALNQIFPNQILVYNYANDSWAINDDCFTTFGYFEQQSDMTWATSAPLQWYQFAGSWIDNIIQANQRQILAGTPEGFILRIATDISRNAASMQITQMIIPSTIEQQAGYVDLIVINHNCAFGDWVAIENAVGITGDFVTTAYQVWGVRDVNTITLWAPNLSGTYRGGGTLARVSNPYTKSKQFNPYDKEGKNVYLARVDFAVEKTQQGQITVDYYASASELSMIEQGQASESITGNSVLETYPYNPAIYPFEQQQKRLWHPIYFQSTGECIQLVFYLDDDQISNLSIAWSDFQLDGMIIYTMRSGDRLQ